MVTLGHKLLALMTGRRAEEEREARFARNPSKEIAREQAAGENVHETMQQELERLKDAQWVIEARCGDLSLMYKDIYFAFKLINEHLSDSRLKAGMAAAMFDERQRQYQTKFRYHTDTAALIKVQDSLLDIAHRNMQMINHVLNAWENLPVFDWHADLMDAKRELASWRDAWKEFYDIAHGVANPFQFVTLSPVFLKLVGFSINLEADPEIGLQKYTYGKIQSGYTAKLNAMRGKSLRAIEWLRDFAAKSTK